MVCPACQDGQRLVGRQVAAGSVAVLECGRCAGFWLGHEPFRGLVERARREVLPDGTTPESPRQVAARFGLPSGAAVPAGGGHVSFYRPCPMCGELMVRRNYAHHSGVVIDLCREHGLWFDADELARILAWVRAGGGREPEPTASATPVSAGSAVGNGGLATESRGDFFQTLLRILLG
jgi:Zn-finger nucleic acid-binding protein